MDLAHAQSIGFHDPLNPPSDAYTDHANAEDIAAMNNNDRTTYTHTCPACGKPAVMQEYTVTTPDQPEPRLRRRIVCKTRLRKYTRGEKCEIVYIEPGRTSIGVQP